MASTDETSTKQAKWGHEHKVDVANQSRRLDDLGRGLEQARRTQGDVVLLGQNQAEELFELAARGLEFSASGLGAMSLGEIGGKLEAFKELTEIIGESDPDFAGVKVRRSSEVLYELGRLVEETGVYEILESIKSKLNILDELRVVAGGVNDDEVVSVIKEKIGVANRAKESISKAVGGAVAGQVVAVSSADFKTNSL